MTNPALIISASMLPEYQDCARRAAFKGFKEEFAKAGFKQAKPAKNIGAAIGTAAHAAFAQLLTEKRDNLEPDRESAVKFAWSTFGELTVDGVMTDPTTDNLETARVQLERVVREFTSSVLPYAHPLLIEEELAVDAGDGFIFIGHMDLYDQSERVEDHKCGAREPKALSQIGGYSILLKSHDYPVREGRLNWFARKKKNQPDVQFKPYVIAKAEKAAYEVITCMKRDWQKFSETNSPGVFAANPGSMRCDQRFCPAFDTPFCDQGGS